MSYWIAGAATVGALTDRKKPLRGALMGAGLGAGGGALMAGGGMGGLMGGGAASGGAAGGAGGLLSGTAASAAPTAGFGLGQPLVTGSLGSSATAGATSPGLLSSVNSTLSQYKPIMDAASTGLSMSGAMNQEQPMQAPEVQQMQGGSQTLAQLSNQGADPQMQGDAQERMRRRQALRGGV
jgi:hypothetical protein